MQPLAENPSETRATSPGSDARTAALLVRDAAIAMARHAGPVALAHFRRRPEVERKGDESPVTEADRATELALRTLIARDFPDDGILGEEFGRQSGAGDAIWIIDPIDGTRSFISGHPLFGMLIGRMTGGSMQASVVSLPATGEVFAAARHGGATLNGQPIRVSGCRLTGEAMIHVNEGERIWRNAPAVFARLMSAGRDRRLGYDCCPYGLLAAGHVDAVVDCGLEPYDYLPVSLLVEEAGGRITDWRGRALTLDSDVNVVAAATPDLHAAMLEIIDAAG